MTTPQTPPTPEQNQDQTQQPPTPPTPPTPPKKESRFKSFFEHIEDWLKEHLGGAVQFEHTAAIALAGVQPILNDLLTLTAGKAEAAKVSGVISQVTSDLNNTSAILAGAQTIDPAHSLDGFLKSIQGNLGTLLADADVKNSAHAEAITAGVSTVLSIVESLRR